MGCCGLPLVEGSFFLLPQVRSREGELTQGQASEVCVEGVGFSVAREAGWGLHAGKQGFSGHRCLKEDPGCFCCCHPWRSAGHSLRRGLRMQEIIEMWMLGLRSCLRACRFHIGFDSVVLEFLRALGFDEWLLPPLVDCFCLRVLCRSVPTEPWAGASTERSAPPVLHSDMCKR